MSVVSAVEQEAAEAGFQSAFESISGANFHQIWKAEAEHRHVEIDTLCANTHTHERDYAKRLGAISDLEYAGFSEGTAGKALVGRAHAVDAGQNSFDVLPA